MCIYISHPEEHLGAVGDEMPYTIETSQEMRPLVQQSARQIQMITMASLGCVVMSVLPSELSA